MITVYALIAVITAIIFDKVLGNIGVVVDAAKSLCNSIIGILAPFIYGFFIAYLMNSPMKWFETRVYVKLRCGKNETRTRRVISVLTTYIVVIGALVWITAYIFPEIILNVQNLILSLQTYTQSIEMNNATYGITHESLNSFLNYLNETFSTQYTLADVINMILTPMMETLSTLPELISTVLTGTVSFAYALLNAVLGLVIAFYMLCEKESFAASIGKFLDTFFKKPMATRLIHTAQNANTVFEKFFIGKTIDSMIIGLLFFIIALTIKLPFAILSSVIIGVTNMIPYFGPFIGAVPVVFITLLVDPVLGLWITLIIFILQQFDGIILGPKILGDSIGMKPIGVIFAILGGGALFGPIGMFFGVPFFAVFKTMFSSFLDRKYREKYLPEEASPQHEISK
jgi:predicted PurR-regulated permease PerM